MKRLFLFFTLCAGITQNGFSAEALAYDLGVEKTFVQVDQSFVDQFSAIKDFFESDDHANITDDQIFSCAFITKKQFDLLQELVAITTQEEYQAKINKLSIEELIALYKAVNFLKLTHPNKIQSIKNALFQKLLVLNGHTQDYASFCNEFSEGKALFKEVRAEQIAIQERREAEKAKAREIEKLVKAKAAARKAKEETEKAKQAKRNAQETAQKEKEQMAAKLKAAEEAQRKAEATAQKAREEKSATEAAKTLLEEEKAHQLAVATQEKEAAEKHLERIKKTALLVGVPAALLVLYKIFR